MLSSKRIALTLLSLTFLVGTSWAGLDRGFGEEIDWKTFEEGQGEAKSSNKPLMLLVHKSWCGACKALKPQFAGSKEALLLSKHFIMVNVEDEEEPSGSQYSPDGGYIPRILFMTPDGSVDASLTNPNGNPQYKYFYSDGPSVVSGMKSALKKLSPNSHVDL